MQLIYPLRNEQYYQHIKLIVCKFKIFLSVQQY